MASVRVAQDGSLVVPPFECAWLTGEVYELRQGGGCVHFEAKAETDITLILRPTPGTKRWQPLQRTSAPQLQPLARQAPAGQPPGQPAAAGAGHAQHASATPSSSSGLVGVVESNYTVIFGSHRNSCLKIEKNGSTVCQVHGVPGARVSSKEFMSYWIDYHSGIMTLGTGDPCLENISQQWVDPDPIADVAHVGLSCWDRHVSYRNIQVQPSHKFELLDRQLQHASSGNVDDAGPPSLLSQCTQVLVANLGQGQVSACRVAQVADFLLPNTRTLYRACLNFLAHNFKQVTSHSGNRPETVPPPFSAGAAAVSPSTSLNTPPRSTGTAVRSFSAPLTASNLTPAVTSEPASSNDVGPMDACAPAASERLSSSQQPVTPRSPLSTSTPPPPQPQAAVWVGADPEFERLPVSLLCDLLLQNTIAVSEKQIFDAVVRWAQGGDRSPGPGSQTDAAATSPSPSQLPTPLSNLTRSPHLTGGDSPASPTAAASTSTASGDGVGGHGGSSGSAVGGAGRMDGGQELVDMQGSMGQDSGASCSTSNQPWQVHDGRVQGAEGAGPSVSALGRADSAAAYGARSAEEVDAVLSLIRYTLMTPQELAFVVEHPLVSSRPALLGLVAEAMELDGMQPAHDTQGGTPGRTMSGGLFAVENRRLLLCSSHDNNRATTARFQRRLLPASHECAFVCDGDQNGVLHFVGTLYGTQAWVNPVLARRVDIRASSPSGRHTDPKALAGDKFLRTNWAGPRYVNGQPDTWWLVDLGAAHTLILTYYTIRHDGSNDFVRSWALQGSCDCVTWTDLQRHTRDPAIKRPGQYMSWPVMGPAAQAPYRAFRLVLTGPTASPHQPYHFALSHVELYGYLHRVTPAELRRPTNE